MHARCCGRRTPRARARQASGRCRVTGAAVPLHRPLLVALDLDAMQLLAGPDVADLESEQLVDVDVAQRLVAVHRERTDRVREGANGVHDGVGLRVGDGEQRRAQAGKVDAAAVERVDGVVRAGVRHDLRQRARRSTASTTFQCGPSNEGT